MLLHGDNVHFVFLILLDVAISDFANAKDTKQALRWVSRGLAINTGEF